MINWNVRFKNKAFWISFIPAVILVIESIGRLFGFELDLSEINDNLAECIDSVFMVLVILGVVIDPTTIGIGDSENAMQYTEPRR